MCTVNSPPVHNFRESIKIHLIVKSHEGKVLSNQNLNFSYAIASYVCATEKLNVTKEHYYIDTNLLRGIRILIPLAICNGQPLFLSLTKSAMRMEKILSLKGKKDRESTDPFVICACDKQERR